MKRAPIGRLATSLGGIAFFWVLGLAALPFARGEDLLTLSGAAYRHVHAVRVEPDGITWEHDGGICKVDFADSPPAIRQAYHYDAAAAAAYHTAQAQAQRQSEEQARSLLQAHEEQKQAHFQAVLAAAASSVAPENPAATELILRRAASPAASAAARALGEQVAAEQARLAEARADRDSLLANPHIWRVVPRLSSYSPSRFIDVPNSEEYKANLHHAAGGFATDSIHDEFYTPLYSTKSYYEEVDRAAAFARGLPQKP